MLFNYDYSYRNPFYPLLLSQTQMTSFSNNKIFACDLDLNCNFIDNNKNVLETKIVTEGIALPHQVIYVLSFISIIYLIFLKPGVIYPSQIAPYLDMATAIGRNKRYCTVYTKLLPVIVNCYISAPIGYLVEYLQSYKNILKGLRHHIPKM